MSGRAQKADVRRLFECEASIPLLPDLSGCAGAVASPLGRTFDAGEVGQGCKGKLWRPRVAEPLEVRRAHGLSLGNGSKFETGSARGKLWRCRSSDRASYKALRSGSQNRRRSSWKASYFGA
jgi:hypothetical protein